MIPLDVLGTYFIACLILAIAPGPDNIFVLTQSALQGRKAGILVVLGLCTGLLFHTTARCTRRGGHFQNVGDCIYYAESGGRALPDLSGMGRFPEWHDPGLRGTADLLCKAGSYTGAVFS